MSAKKRSTKSEEEQRRRVEELEARLAEAEETLRAIREGEVDAVIVSGTKGEQVFSLIGTDSIYRLIVETMKEAAFTATFDGTILFCNAQFGQFEIGRAHV
jgi:PAS domain-containing protein